MEFCNQAKEMDKLLQGAQKFAMKKHWYFFQKLFQHRIATSFPEKTIFIVFWWEA